MSRLIVKLLLSIAAFPAAIVIGVLFYVFAFLVADGIARSEIASAVLFMIPWCLMVLSFQLSWLWIWRRSIRWTGVRRVGTIAVMIGSIAMPIGVLVIAMGSHDPPFALFGFLVLYVTSIPLQLSLLWRSTRSEEAERLADWRIAPNPRCPYCQGLLAGRVGASCPHCGGDLVGESVKGVSP